MGKYDRKKVFFLSTSPGVPPKSFCGVFELPLLRNAQKLYKKKLKEKNNTYLPPFIYSGHLPDVRRFPKTNSSAPLV
jgi:hypothetical protein